MYLEYDGDDAFRIVLEIWNESMGGKGKFKGRDLKDVD